jgi:hypothetical protein
MAVLYGRAGYLIGKIGGFWPGQRYEQLAVHQTPFDVGAEHSRVQLPCCRHSRVVDCVAAAAAFIRADVSKPAVAQQEPGTANGASERGTEGYSHMRSKEAGSDQANGQRESFDTISTATETERRAVASAANQSEREGIVKAIREKNKWRSWAQSTGQLRPTADPFVFDGEKQTSAAQSTRAAGGAASRPVGSFVCDKGCGFKGEFNAVADHELGCTCDESEQNSTDGLPQPAVIGGGVNSCDKCAHPWKLKVWAPILAVLSHLQCCIVLVLITALRSNHLTIRFCWDTETYMWHSCNAICSDGRKRICPPIQPQKLGRR